MFYVSRGYNYIWQAILALPFLDSPILKLAVEEPWKDGSFSSENLIFVVQTNDVYCCRDVGSAHKQIS